MTVLTSVNYLNYIDRFMLAALLPAIQLELKLNDFQAGLLATAFMVAYMLTAPYFGILGDTYRRTKLLAVGVLIWSVASLLSGRSGIFEIMLFSRFLLGIGESVFTTISAPYISDFYPPSRRGRAFSIFASATPVGAALGYVLGGLLGSYLGWRNSFLIAGVPGIILAFVILFLPEPRHLHESHKVSFMTSLKELKANWPYLHTVFGYTAFTFVIGGLAHWMPSFIQREYNLPLLKANVMFGAVTVISGFIGTMVGGFWSDRLKATKRCGPLMFSAICMVLATPFYVFCLYTHNLTLFFASMSATQLLFFMTTSPINIAIMEFVSPNIRTIAMAIAIFACHILGDAISAPLIGWISDVSGSLIVGMVASAPFIVIGAIFWHFGNRMSHAPQG